MKRFLPIFLILGVAAPLFAQTATVVREPALADTVSVTGTGQAMIVPDRFTFTVGVQSVAKTVDEAVSENNQRVAAVIAALKRAGAEEGDIQTAHFNIWPQQDHSQGALPRILGYQVTNSVTVRSRKVADAGRLLGVAIAAGVNTSSGINFEVSDPARGRDQGLRAAFEDARARAALLAQAAGRTLGRAIYISEGTLQQVPPPYPMPRAMAMESRVAADVPVESGTQERSYTISVTFELR
jgi:uncharacterized protein